MPLLRRKQETDEKLCDAMSDVELLKENLSGLELAQEEANSLLDMVHSNNDRLEHDVAFLKAVLNDTVADIHHHPSITTSLRFGVFLNVR